MISRDGSAEKKVETETVDTNGVMIRLSLEESINLVEAVLHPSRAPNPPLIAAAKRYLTATEGKG